MDDAAEHLIKNAETMGKIAHEMAVMEGLIDEMGLVTAKAKNLGITQKMIQPFSYKPSGLN